MNECKNAIYRKRIALIWRCNLECESYTVANITAIRKLFGARSTICVGQSQLSTTVRIPPYLTCI